MKMEVGLVCGLDQIPSPLLHAITFDQGSEWTCWESLAVGYDIGIWISDPHAPLQRGQVENLNCQWRW